MTKHQSSEIPFDIFKIFKTQFSKKAPKADFPDQVYSFFFLVCLFTQALYILEERIELPSSEHLI